MGIDISFYKNYINYCGVGMAVNIVSAEIEPAPDQMNRAASALQRLGFRILHIGATISVQGPQPLWESTFNVSFKPEKKRVAAELEEAGEVTYQKSVTENIRIPIELQDLIHGVFFTEPPELY